jgi:hypothetical protein
MSDLLNRGFSKLYWEIRKTREVKLNKGKNKALLLLILISGVFCFKAIWTNFTIYAQADQRANQQWIPGISLENQKMSVNDAVLEKRKMVAEFDSQLPEKKSIKAVKLSDFEIELSNLVDDYPIREMVPFITKKDRVVAALVVGIAKKESDWGRHAPSKNGEDCYNYWGYKGAGGRGAAMGYACFESTEEAVKIVAGRIEHFVGKNMNTPAKMVIWKCGGSCAWDNPANVQKWISDVSKYYNQIAYVK